MSIILFFFFSQCKNKIDSFFCKVRQKSALFAQQDEESEILLFQAAFVLLVQEPDLLQKYNEKVLPH